MCLQPGGITISTVVGRGTAKLKVTTTSLSAVSHDTCLCRKNEQNSYACSISKTATDEWSVCLGWKRDGKFPKQTYLSPIQSDQRLAVCHNFLHGGDSPLTVLLGWTIWVDIQIGKETSGYQHWLAMFVDVARPLWRSSSGFPVVFHVTVSACRLNQLTCCCAEARGGRVGVLPLKSLSCWFLIKGHDQLSPTCVATQWFSPGWVTTKRPK